MEGSQIAYLLCCFGSSNCEFFLIISANGSLNIDSVTMLLRINGW
jgi:hypothetical protein